MQAEAAPVARRALTIRSKVTNGTRALIGVDGRSATARRYRDLVVAYATDIEPAGFTGLSEAEQALVRQAATLTLRSEQLQSQVVNGEPVDPDELVRLNSEARRTLDRIRKREKPKQPTLADYLARRREAAA